MVVDGLVGLKIRKRGEFWMVPGRLSAALSEEAPCQCLNILLNALSLPLHCLHFICNLLYIHETLDYDRCD